MRFFFYLASLFDKSVLSHVPLILVGSGVTGICTFITYPHPLVYIAILLQTGVLVGSGVTGICTYIPYPHPLVCIAILLQTWILVVLVYRHMHIYHVPTPSGMHSYPPTDWGSGRVWCYRHMYIYHVPTPSGIHSYSPTDWGSGRV